MEEIDIKICLKKINKDWKNSKNSKKIIVKMLSEKDSYGKKRFI